MSRYCVYLDEVLVLLRIPLQAQASQQVFLPSFDQLIENVEVPLSVVLVDNAGLLQQVVDDVASNRGALPTGQRPGGNRGGGVEGRVGVGEAGVLRKCCGMLNMF